MTPDSLFLNKMISTKTWVSIITLKAANFSQVKSFTKKLEFPTSPKSQAKEAKKREDFQRWELLDFYYLQFLLINTYLSSYIASLFSLLHLVPMFSLNYASFGSSVANRQTNIPTRLGE